MIKTPKTRYPSNMERSYASNVKKLLAELDNLVLYEFDNTVAPLITAHRLLTDSERNDSVMLGVRRAIEKIKQLSLGAFADTDIGKAVGKFTKGVSTTNKTNMSAQLKVKGVNPIETEPWLKSFLGAKTQENVSYIKGIRDNYTQNVEQTILRGVTSGQSTSEMRKEILKSSDISVVKAEFIARDQTGTLLGQMNAERHQRAGIIAFRWSDSGDNRVRDNHAERDGKLYFYADNPLLPGEDYGCRCVAEPVDDDELEEENLEFGLTPNEEHAINKYVSSDSYIINDKLRNDFEVTAKDKDFMTQLDKALEKLPDYSGDLTRSYFFKSRDEVMPFVRDYKIGKVTEFKEYFSTTKAVYSETDDVRFVILNSRTGKDLGSFNKNEKEVLFNKNAKFKVVDRYLYENKPYIVLEEI